MTKYILIFSCLVCSIATAQEANKPELLTVFGIQYKPIIPAAYFDAASISAEWEGFAFDLQPQYSYSLGMVVRKGLSKTFSVEYGINYIQQNYRLGMQHTELELGDVTDFGIRSYEIPFQALVYVQVAPDWFLNAAFGLSSNIIASDVFSYGEVDPEFFQNTFRRKRHQTALIANVGAEYRTEKKGFYYIGLSLHRPWKDIARVYPEYDGVHHFNDLAPNEEAYYLELLGNFLTLDLRYFFGK